MLVTTLIVISSIALGLWAQEEFARSSSHDVAIEVVIPPGSSIGSIVTILQDNGAIEDSFHAPLIFTYGGRLTDQATKLKAGEYSIPAHASIADILDLLESGKVIQRNITIREGLTNWEIHALLSDHKSLDQVKVELPAEGTLLPETYSYAKGDSNADIINRMTSAHDNILNTAWENRAENLPFDTKEEALVLASIIEKETAVPSERRDVAGVFVNRLRMGMLLQTDPTVIYALTLGQHENEGQGPLGRRLLRKDLSYDSPYNTYLYAGLPPGPICNPGKASIEAALNPASHKYIYFVADGTGGHAFGKTLAEHNRNVAKWRKIRKGQ